MRSFCRGTKMLLLVALLVAPSALGQVAQREPHIGYAYPAGGQVGTTFEVRIGGQYLDGASEVIVSGRGVRGEVLEHKKPLTIQQVNRLRQKLEDARKKAGLPEKPSAQARINPTQMRQMALDAGVTAEELQMMAEMRRARNDPKVQPNPQIEETVTLRLTVEDDADRGERELRLMVRSGLSNPVYFHVGEFPEHRESEPNDDRPDRVRDVAKPFVLNGQIQPGDVDQFQFGAAKGEKLVLAASARELIPYLADAVPGWFQATMSLTNELGREVAFADDFRFHPDPVFYFEVPTDGLYTLSIKDALYRGRADFVYRVTVGEIPCVTSIFPLGGPVGSSTDLELTGWNLDRTHVTLNAPGKEPGVVMLSNLGEKRLSHEVLFEADSLPEKEEVEGNNDLAHAERVYPPLIVNGRIQAPGDWDVYAFECRAGGEIFAEVKARRLNSPLDSILRLTMADGRQLAVNDDHEDKAAGLTTHHADSRIRVTIPNDGLYYLYVGDAQGMGDSAWGYRLHINAQRPDYELRVVPSSINARGGTSVPITVHALRKDGFTGDILLRLKNAPEGYRLAGGWVPEGQDHVRMTLTVPATPTKKPLRLDIEGRAEIEGRTVRRMAVPADDLMQAFIYRHLLPAENLLVSVTQGARFRGPGTRGNAPFSGRGPMANRRKRPVPVFIPKDQPVDVPIGGSTRVPLPLPPVPMLQDVELELSDAPEGITIEKVSGEFSGTALLVKCDNEKVPPGLKGNLIVNAFVERSFTREDGSKSPARRIPLGTLPAIPYQIVAR